MGRNIQSQKGSCLNTFRQLTAISAENFSGKAWRRYTGYAFAAGETLIPLVVAELAQAVPAMPLGFVQSGEGFQLVAVTALQPGANLFVAPNGRWLGAYVPAALRGYPFRLVKPQDREDSVLCIDEASGLVVEAGQGETFFDEDGRPSKALRGCVGAPLAGRTEPDGDPGGGGRLGCCGSGSTLAGEY